MPTHLTDFQGFPRETFSLLADLSTHNQKAWFDANKDRFRRFVEQPVQDIVSVIRAHLLRQFQNITHLEGKVFRIHRDIRFSKDKSPYKTHVGIRFSEDASKDCAAPFFYVQLEAKSIHLVIGQKEFDGDTLVRYRTAVMDARTGRALASLVEKMRQDGATLQGEQLQKIPRGYPADHDRADFLRFKGLYMEKGLPVTERIYSSGVVQLCLDQFSRWKLLYDWLKSL